MKSGVFPRKACPCSRYFLILLLKFLLLTEGCNPVRRIGFSVVHLVTLQLRFCIQKLTYSWNHPIGGVRRWLDSGSVAVAGFYSQGCLNHSPHASECTCPSSQVLGLTLNTHLTLINICSLSPFLSAFLSWGQLFKFSTMNHRIIKAFQLEKSFKITKSHHPLTLLCLMLNHVP